MINSLKTRSQDAFKAICNLKQGPEKIVIKLYTKITTFKANFGVINEFSRIRTLNATLTNQELKKMLVFILHKRLATFISY